jgi:CheY-like chemotaxis protein
MLESDYQGSESILVIEDDDNLRVLILETLEDAGYTLTGTHSPDEAIALAQKQPFALVLADVRMAGSTDGVGAVEKIKQIQPYIRSIIMTGYASLEVPVRAAKIKADDYLLKGDQNFGVTELLRVVRRTLDQEKESSSALLRFLSLPGKLAKAPIQAWLDAKLPELERERESFFKSLYVLIRPGHLSKEDAFLIWRRLEKLELSFHSITVPHFVKLRGAYASLELDLNPRTSVNADNQEKNDTPREAFYAFYERVRAGKVTYEQFERAARLRCHLEARKENVEAYALYYWLWSPAQQRDIESFVGRRVGPLTLTKVHLNQGAAKCTYAAKHDDGRAATFLVDVFPETEETSALLEGESSYSHRENTLKHYFCVQAKTLENQKQEQQDESNSSLLVHLFPARQKPSIEKLWDLASALCDHLIEKHSSGQILDFFSIYGIFLKNGKVEFSDYRPKLPEPCKASIFKASDFDYINYLSPEHVEGNDITPLSNQYSLGAIILALSAERARPISTIERIRSSWGGKPLFSSPTPFEEQLTSVLTKMLKEQPSDRYKTVQEAKQALASVFEPEMAYQLKETA